MMEENLFHSRPWMTETEVVRGRPAGFLGGQEAALLYYVVRDYYRGHGDIIDAGAFLGASSFCLGQGLEDNVGIKRKAGRLHAYDLFHIWSESGSNDADSADHVGRAFGLELANYESTIGVYAANVGKLARLIQVHPGDILRETWSGRPIEIFFVDVCKTKSIWLHLLREFFPSLVPGISLVIHQDWHHPLLPFLHVAQEALADYFEIVVSKADDSVVFRLVDRIPDRVLDRVSRYEFSPADEINLMDSAIGRFPGQARFMRLAKAELLRSQGQIDAASRTLHDAYVHHGETLTPEDVHNLSHWASVIAYRIEHEAAVSGAAHGFDEAAYLAANPGAAEIIRQGHLDSGWRHWFRHGRWE